MEVIWDLAMNLGVLSLIANLVTKTRAVQSLFFERRESLVRKTLLALLLGVVCIFSTSSGIHLENVIVNTRVIGALAAGILGGPYAGTLTGLIGGVHRYLYDPSGFTAVACSISTVLAGITGGLLSARFSRGRWNLVSLALLTAAMEVLHMILILVLCRPFVIAVDTVRTIAMPMILINSLGMVVFVTIIRDIYKTKDAQTEEKLRLALSVAEKSLPYFRKGISSPGEMTEAARELLFAKSIFSGIAITDHERILALETSDSRMSLPESETLLTLSRKALLLRETLTLTYRDGPEDLRGILRNFNIVAAPLIQMNQPAGCLIVFIRRKWLHEETDIGLVKGLGSLMSTQLELSEMEYQKRLRHKAELSALQSQVNPHFLYNALNTLACICREDPSRARELLLIMGSYYRQTLEQNRSMISLGEEIQHLDNYLVLEKARFEEKLTVDLEISTEEALEVPLLILQPIVENAVKYGVDGDGNRRIRIFMEEGPSSTSIHVEDSGPGFSDEALAMLEKERSTPAHMEGTQRQRSHLGLLNVKKRLKSVYGEGGELKVTSTGSGSLVELKIPRVS